MWWEVAVIAHMNSLDYSRQFNPLLIQDECHLS